MNDLPPEIYPFIFKHLHLIELFNVRLVSKKLNLMVKLFNVDELALSNITVYKFLDWFHTNKLKNLKKEIPGKTFLLTHPLFNIQNLKRLKINLNEYNAINFGHINQFQRLQYLEIYSDFSSFVGREKQPLCLVNLKSLRLYSFCDYANSFDDSTNNKIIINTPALKALEFRISHLNYFNFINPHSIKYLSVDGSPDDELKLFNKVEHFKYESNENFDGNLLAIFPNLKEIDVENSTSENSIYFYEYPCLEDIIGPYPLAKNDIYDLIYRDLVYYRIPNDFFQKFYRINHLHVHDKIELYDRLIEFIGNCQNLCCLSIEKSELNQKFYDQLPSVSSLSELKIEETKDIGLNFKFINKMVYLNEFYTNQQLDLDDCEIEMNKFIFLRSFVFKFMNVKIGVQRLNRDRFKFNFFEEKDTGLPQEEELNYEQVLNWLNSLRNNDLKIVFNRLLNSFKKMFS